MTDKPLDAGAIPGDHADLHSRLIQARDPEVAAHVTKRRWEGKLKYPPRPQIDDAITEAYREYRENGSRTAIKTVAKRVGWPDFAVKQRARKLGLSRTKEPTWSPAEEEILAKLGHLGDGSIQKHLARAGYQRSTVAIHLKMKRLRIKQNLEGYSATALALALGEDSHKILKWIESRILPAERRGTERTEKQGGDVWWITHEAVRKFVSAYPGEIRLARVEKWWFLDLVSTGAISEKSAELGDLRAKVGMLIAASREQAKVEARRREQIARLERELEKAMEAARTAEAKCGKRQRWGAAIRNQLAWLSDDITRLQGLRMTRKDALGLLDQLARLEMTLHLPAEQIATEPANAVEGFLAAIQQTVGGASMRSRVLPVESNQGPQAIQSLGGVCEP